VHGKRHWKHNRIKHNLLIQIQVGKHVAVTFETDWQLTEIIDSEDNCKDYAEKENAEKHI
jgi:hypothetical protein